MAKFTILPPKNNVEAQAAFFALQLGLNGNLGLENFKGRLISGVTSTSADTKMIIYHGLTPPPVGGIVLLGNVYIYQIDQDYIDVRSAQTSVAFTIFALNSKIG